MDELKKILVGVDFSPRSLHAAQMAITIAEPMDASVELVHVVEAHLSDHDAIVLGKSKPELVDLLVDEARVALDSFSAQLDYGNIRTTVLSGSPAIELTKLSEERSANLLVIGDAGAQSSVPHRGVGVTACRLVERGPRNVLVVKAGHGSKIRSVAAAISFVPVADDVLQQAHFLARIWGAELHVLRVIPDITELRHRLSILSTDIERRLSDSVYHNEKRLREFVDHYRIHDVVLKTVALHGYPGSMLVDYLHKESIDVIVMGTGTTHRIAGYPVGSTTHRVLNQTLSSVYVVRSLEPPA